MRYWNAPLKLLTQNNNMLKRNLIPGSEWLYYKLYPGAKSNSMRYFVKGLSWLK